MNILNRLLLIIVIVLMAATPAFAVYPDAQVRLEALMANVELPTGAQVLDAIGENIDHNPLTQNSFQLAENHPSKMIQGYLPFAQAIVAFEKAFPGATIAFLGRDASFAGQMMDIFYTSIGQKGRVVLLRASGGSVRNVRPGKLFGFLKSNGLPTEIGDETPPFIGADRTSYGSTSQGRYLMAAAYSKLTKMGYSPKQLVHKVNFVNLSGQTTNDPGTFLESVSAGKHGPDDIITINMSPYIDQGEWNDGYGSIWKRFDGSWRASVKDNRDVSARRGILGRLIDAAAAITSQEFLEMVKREAKTQGFAFPMERTPWSRETHPLMRISEEMGSMENAFLKLKKDGKLLTLFDMPGFWTFEFDKELKKALPALIRFGLNAKDATNLLEKFKAKGRDEFLNFSRKLVPLFKIDESLWLIDWIDKWGHVGFWEGERYELLSLAIKDRTDFNEVNKALSEMRHPWIREAPLLQRALELAPTEAEFMRLIPLRPKARGPMDLIAASKRLKVIGISLINLDEFLTIAHLNPKESAKIVDNLMPYIHINDVPNPLTRTLKNIKRTVKLSWHLHDLENKKRDEISGKKTGMVQRCADLFKFLSITDI